MATEELAGVGEESPELGKTTESTSESSDPPHQGIELDERNSGGVRSHRKSTVLPENLAGG
jgi:hypothetical protein